MFGNLKIYSGVATKLPNVLNVTSKCQVHIQIGKKGERLVVSHRHNIKTNKEKWQNVVHMGYEDELINIKRIERDERLQADPKMAKITADGKMNKLKNKLQNAG